MENGLVNLLNRMDRRFGHAIVCLDGYTDFRRRLERDDVALHDIAKKPGLDPAHYKRLFGQLRRLRPALVHTRNIGTIEAGVIARLAGVRNVIHGEHGFDVADLHGDNPRYRRLRRACSPLINRFVCVSRQIADWLRTQVGIGPHKLVQIYNGVDCDKFNPGNRDEARARLREAGVRSDFVVGLVGRLEAVKNPSAALTAFAARCGQDPAFRDSSALVLVGGGSLEKELHAAVSRSGLGDRVHLLGRREDVDMLLAGFDVFVLPSRNEGISNTILEAMACGVPVLASRVGGNPELVEEGRTGYLYDCDDVDALAHLMAMYHRDLAARRQHAAAARVRANDRFSIGEMVGQYESLYAEFT